MVATIQNHRLTEVTLVGHSYGGQVIAGVASALPGALARLVYLDASVPNDGQSATEQQPETIALEVLGVTDPADVEWLSALMVPHPYKSFNDPVRVTTESLAVASTFIESVDWIRVFQGARERAQSRGWPVHELQTGHQSMNTAPRELAALLDQIVRQS